MSFFEVKFSSKTTQFNAQISLAYLALLSLTLSYLI